VEPLPFTEYIARRMIEGTEYQIRVRAVNEVGVGEPSQPSIAFTPLGKFTVLFDISLPIVSPQVDK